ncbi:MAG: phosphoglycerate kinase [Deltaproteobacteria bacterium]|nr:MAG: phosphoglycerate kinase [Deltaproteobacteria bacterium]
MAIRTLRDLTLDGKRVLVRVDFNVPVDEKGRVRDDTRIRAALPTIRYLVEKKCRVVLMSHLGRPKGKWVDSLSLKPVAERLSRLLRKKVVFPGDVVGEKVKEAVDALKPGEVLLLENLRFYPGEEKNDPEFAKQLAEYGDVFVNDAFGTAHRGHASNSAVTKFFREKAAGFLMENEISYFERALKNPVRPVVAIFGGAKVSGKIQAITNVMKRVEKILIGGAMANTFFAALGFGVGKSLFEEEMVPVAQKVLREARKRGVRLYFPVDVVVAPELSAKARTSIVPVQEIPDDMMALDTGPATRLLFREAIQDARTIVWNGPMGAFEFDPFSRGTYALIEDLASSHALTIVGGGDTDTALHRTGLFDRMSYVSTGGGAFLELLEGKKLPGIEALR